MSYQPPKRAPRLPDGSGFARLVGKRADKNNLPGKQNDFGDRVSGTFQTNTQFGTGRGPLSLRSGGSERAGQRYRTGLTSSGRTVHVYENGQRIVLPKRKPKYVR